MLALLSSPSLKCIANFINISIHILATDLSVSAWGASLLDLSAVFPAYSWSQVSSDHTGNERNQTITITNNYWILNKAITKTITHIKKIHMILKPINTIQWSLNMKAVVCIINTCILKLYLSYPSFIECFLYQIYKSTYMNSVSIILPNLIKI